MKISGFRKYKHLNLSLQYTQPEFNDCIPTWMAIDNFIPIPEITTELISVALQDLWNAKTNDNTGGRIRNTGIIGECRDDAKLFIAVINYSYNVIVQPTNQQNTTELFRVRVAIIQSIPN